MNIGDNIKLLREKRGLSRKDLAMEIGVSEATISRYENGKREPNMDTLKNICITLGITMNDLTGEIHTADNLINNTNKKYYSNLTSSELKDLLSPQLNLNVTAFENMTDKEKIKFIDDLSKINPFKLQLQKYIDNFSDFSKEDLINISNGILEYGHNLVMNFIDTDFSNLLNDYNNLVNNNNKLISEYNTLLELLSAKDEYIERLQKNNDRYEEICNEFGNIMNKISTTVNGNDKN